MGKLGCRAHFQQLTCVGADGDTFCAGLKDRQGTVPRPLSWLAGAQMRMDVQGVLSAATQRLEGHRDAMQAGLAEATSLVTTTSHAGKQQRADGEQHHPRICAPSRLQQSGPTRR